jgi:uncharacterized membrane protein (Fun14 family)
MHALRSARSVLVRLPLVRSRTAVRAVTAALIVSPLFITGVVCEGSNDGNKGIWDSVADTARNTGDAVATQAGDMIDNFLKSGVGGQITWGFASGFCSGYAIKKVSKVFALGIGLFFVAVQGLSYAGYAHVDYNKANAAFENALDLNKDGVVNSEDAKVAFNKMMEVLQYNIPAGSGFVTGVVLGLRTG